MIKDKASIKGKVTVKVFGPDGKIKRRDDSLWFRIKYFFTHFTWIPEGAPMVSVNHNIVTNEGDALIADLMSDSPARTKVDNTNGHMCVGTGFSSAVKTQTALNTIVGSPNDLDAGYPQVKGSFGSTDDNVTVYRSTFGAGVCTSDGLDEVSLINNAAEASGDMLAYAEIDPAVNKGASDSLEITWELTFTGS